jgi:glycosyltransferase involved in cell wall biosynthesis
VYGGAEFLADSLRDRLVEHGHEAMLVKVPFAWDPPTKILDHMLACRLLKLEHVDRVIALKFPAYYVEHDNKVLWMLHQFRQAYDLWDTPYNCFPKTTEGLSVRQTIINADNRYLMGAKKIYTISDIVTDRLRKYNNIDSSVLYPPLDNSGIFNCTDYGDYFFYPSRINFSKRQHLAIESMRFVQSGVKLVIAGSPDTKDDIDHIEKLVRKYNLHDRVTIIREFISQERKAELFANALGCTFIPFNEDYGYVTLEAYYSRKPVIACDDSGGTDIFVKDGMTGLVVPPDAKAIAGAMDKLYYNRNLAKEYGNNGYQNLISLNITWEQVVKRLTA